jgi:hypothetical protein
MITENHNNPDNSNNNLSDDDNNDSDGHDFLYNFFSAELNLTDTESNFENNPIRFDKKFAKETNPASKRLKIDDNLDEN